MHTVLDGLLKGEGDSFLSSIISTEVKVSTNNKSIKQIFRYWLSLSLSLFTWVK